MNSKVNNLFGITFFTLVGKSFYLYSASFFKYDNHMMSFFPFNACLTPIEKRKVLKNAIPNVPSAPTSPVSCTYDVNKNYTLIIILAVSH